MNALPDEVLPLVEELKRIPGVLAIVLGGSRARGGYTPESDVDLGLYYRQDNPLDVQALDRLASCMDDRLQTGLVTPIGGWGSHINGGGWLQIAGREVDLIYRNLELVEQTVDECIEGSVRIDIQPGHPFGFLSSTYAGEAALCLPLWDPQGEMTSLKNRLAVFPLKLKLALIRQFAWEIQFNARLAEKAIPRMDIAYISGCLFRSVECMLLVLFALNEQYWMNEKGALGATVGFSICPEHFKSRVEAAFAQLRMDKAVLGDTVATVKELGSVVNAMAEPFLGGN